MEENDYYVIPANYTDSGRILGGMLKTRNAIEAALAVFILGVAEINVIPMHSTVRIAVMVLTIIPVGVAAMVGIEGESLIQYLGHMLKFLRNRRKLHFKAKEHGIHEK